MLEFPSPEQKKFRSREKLILGYIGTAQVARTGISLSKSMDLEGFCTVVVWYVREGGCEQSTLGLSP